MPWFDQLELPGIGNIIKLKQLVKDDRDRNTTVMFCD
jgi:hypothetical protein